MGLTSYSPDFDDKPFQIHDGEFCLLHFDVGKRGHGLNGRDADLTEQGQIRVLEAWGYADDDSCKAEFKLIATIAPDTDALAAALEPQMASLRQYNIAYLGDNEWEISSDPITVREPMPLECDGASLEDCIGYCSFALWLAIETHNEVRAWERSLSSFHETFDELDKIYGLPRG